ncbi:uncharacterized protein LOC130891498 [Diorhabda carinulata]|uniref:uncharacterized protein LOC130891498 n=1 Tax=Diorhabda carinulata TaxID=1163345 RepID=UPI0025A1EE30|nr:uncharacterized protein LOC130891498 [Diorhabda carinulata]
MFKQTVYFLVVSSLFVQSFCSENCGDSVECLENQLVTQINQFERDENIGGFISLKKIGRTSKSVKEKEDLFERCLRFLKEHEIRIAVPESGKRSFEEESRTKRLRRYILPLILLLKLKAAIILPVILSMISFVSFAGLNSGMAAFLISGAVAFKSFLETHTQPKISYEVVPPIAPHWSRTSLEEGLPIAGYQTII